MRSIRIHIDAPLTIGTEIALPAQAAEHVARVLRMQPGDALQVFNGDGHDYVSTISAVGKREVTIAIDNRTAVDNESPLPLILVQGVARGDKMDLIVQKATELGVHAIVPITTERSEVKLDAARADKRWQHWRAVAISACEQSGRAYVPAIAPATTLTAWLASLGDDGRARVALLPTAAHRAAELKLDAQGAWLVVGPEGGLGDRDTALLNDAGFSALRLGPRILRTETAGLAALAALQALHGDI
jgi:16S rRNA (uracil1498-N3)-methyltransferase